MNIRPLADRVLVLPAPAEEKVGGIIIPDTAKEKPLHGKIVATGNGTKDEEMVLKVGDEVLYGKIVNKVKQICEGENVRRYAARHYRLYLNYLLFTSEKINHHGKGNKI